MERRKFFKDIFTSIKRATGEFVYEVSKPLEPILRSPFALPEEEFLAKCQRCERCVKNCKGKVLKIFSKPNFIIFGTPYLDFKEGYCLFCETCLKVCPSKALIKKANPKIGIAKINPEKCVAFRGIFCQTCYWECPKKDEAIILKDNFKIEINPKACIGCGKCVNVCPLNEEGAIKIVPL